MFCYRQTSPGLFAYAAVGCRDGLGKTDGLFVVLPTRDYIRLGRWREEQGRFRGRSAGPLLNMSGTEGND